MMTAEYLLDTNACIAIRRLLHSDAPGGEEARRKLAAFRQRWEALDGKVMAMSLITLGELEYGASKSQSAHARSKLDKLLAAVTVLLPDQEVARHYGRLRHELSKKPIGPNDAWIAAHGRAEGLKVVTDNTDEFGRVPDLAIENWMI